MNWTTLAGLGLVGLSAGLMLFLAALRRKEPPVFRRIAAFSRLGHAIGRAVEDGSRLHVSLGSGGLTTPQSASALAGLTVLRRLADLTSAGDKPPVASSGDGAVAILSQDMLQVSYQDATAGGFYDATAGRLAGLTPFSYAAGTIPIMRDEHVSANVLIGNFGVEAGLLADTAERKGSFTLSATDNLPAQAVLYAGAQDPLIGEELYAAGAYVNAGPFHAASLAVQDILRWLAILAILAGALLKMVGLL
ncbi:MAG: hypothetical protein FJZ96_01360 [Chloroflexi bacterium]|nr:hypothetical protein [Chloroflexota bacterium]